jgi:hypothetical protein
VGFVYPSAPTAENSVARDGIFKMLLAPVGLGGLIASLVARQGVSALVVVLGVPYLFVAVPLAAYLFRYRVAVGDGWLAQRGFWRWHVVDLTSLADVRGRNRRSQRIRFRDTLGRRAVLWDAVDGAWEVEKLVRESVWEAHRSGRFSLRPEVRRVLGMPEAKYPPDAASSP